MEGPAKLKSEVKTNSQNEEEKAVGPDKIVMEMLTALDDFGNDKFIEVVNELYKNAEILGAISRLIFIALLKKPGMNA